jgi:hypothetical protein
VSDLVHLTRFNVSPRFLRLRSLHTGHTNPSSAQTQQGT